MNLRFDWFIRPILWIAWWLLKCEIVLSHERFRAANNQGEMMLDVENVFQALDEYLTGGVTSISAAAGLEEPEATADAQPPRAAGPFGAEDELDEEPFGPNDDIGEIAYQHARQENGRIVDRTVYEGQHDEKIEREQTRNEARTARNQYFARAENLDADMLESPRTRRRRYLDSEMEEVSEPDEWAEAPSLWPLWSIQL